MDSKLGMNVLRHKVMSPFSLNLAIAVALISSKGPYIKPMEKSSEPLKVGVGREQQSKNL